MDNLGGRAQTAMPNRLQSGTEMTGCSNPHFIVDEAHETLHPIQDGLNLELNS